MSSVENFIKPKIRYLGDNFEVTRSLPAIGEDRLELLYFGTI